VPEAPPNQETANPRLLGEHNEANKDFRGVDPAETLKTNLKMHTDSTANGMEPSCAVGFFPRAFSQPPVAPPHEVRFRMPGCQGALRLGHLVALSACLIYHMFLIKRLLRHLEDKQIIAVLRICAMADH